MEEREVAGVVGLHHLPEDVDALELLREDVHSESIGLGAVPLAAVVVLGVCVGVVAILVSAGARLVVAVTVCAIRVAALILLAA